MHVMMMSLFRYWVKTSASAIKAERFRMICTGHKAVLYRANTSRNCSRLKGVFTNATYKSNIVAKVKIHANFLHGGKFFPCQPVEFIDHPVDLTTIDVYGAFHSYSMFFLEGFCRLSKKRRIRILSFAIRYKIAAGIIIGIYNRINSKFEVECGFRRVILPMFRLLSEKRREKDAIMYWLRISHRKKILGGHRSNLSVRIRKRFLYQQIDSSEAVPLLWRQPRYS
jgi:hypothetical protein